ARRPRAAGHPRHPLQDGLGPPPGGRPLGHAPRGGGPVSSGRERLVLAAEVLLGAITLAAVLGMSRLFDGGGWLGPIAANAVAAHLVATGLRRRGLSLPVAAAVMVPAAALVISWTCYW